ncbi:SRPBCC domain-containing protein [Bdellovibrio sp. NC01]|uniref:SRPBCC family protein n=1 Tax=Bdellovibrio sp. NC01 TaxID=2220073 RepID=UPI0011574A1C|nr:SRPBCC domain-containing protein [Bdellovibrio sp. NC01]QDK39324.1 SRPBCC domain-containing protein [Bdellovibrio sp. NC01]
MKTAFITIISISVVIFLVIAITGRMTKTVVVSRTFNAPLETVWTRWNDTESIKQYWGPKNYTAPKIENDFREGGSFLFAMRSPSGETFYNAGKYTQIIPKEKIAATLSFADENGNLIPGSEVKAPGHWPDAVNVTVTFKDVGGKTEVTVQEDGIPALMYILAKMGWQQQMDKFELLVK